MYILAYFLINSIQFSRPLWKVDFKWGGEGLRSILDLKYYIHPVRNRFQI